MDARDIESPELRLSRWWTLPVVSAAQLLVVLDGTIVNIALPSAQSALGMSDGSRPWVVTAYALAFGGLLLIGGRVGSTWGHRRAFGIGLAGFAVASALGGAAGNQETLFAARALQGAFAAVLAPAGLSLLTMTFTGPRERGRALGVFAAVGAAGSAIGLIAGGLLAEYAGWRWCLYINVPVALLALLGTALVPADRPHREGGRLDVLGALLSALGFAAVVYALLGSTVAGRLHGRLAPGLLILPGLGAAAAGVLILTRLTTQSTDVLPLHLVPALVLTGLGLGCVLPPTASLATSDVRPQDIGAASAAYNAAQQLGAALGTALLNTVAAGASASYAASSAGRVSRDAVSVHGYTVALAVAFGILLAAACVAGPLVLRRAGRRSG
ncbi:MFS transporter [Streptomyces paradoxus]|uniref:MFS family permease n=1 Tax=Streptomyces paradoxus TaxID=66375 RepID=A0A7W9TC23_9ACTN|nr:MFS transporter [Streptomyces paradoxus]MBB6077263.1 MFS family permease [Streptomyces paradoxus]